MTDTLITLEELLSEAAEREEEDEVLDKLKALAIETLPVGWREDKVLNLSKEALFGDEDKIDPQVLNKIRFALPTCGIVRAFKPEAQGLGEKAFKQMKICMLDWSFCRALITSPPGLANRIRGSAVKVELFLQLIKPAKPLFISRAQADEELRRDAIAAGTLEEDEGIKEPDAKRARIDDEFKVQVVNTLQMLSDKIDTLQGRNHPRDLGEGSDSDRENSYSEYDSGGSDNEETPWAAPELGLLKPRELDTEWSLAPIVKECEPPIAEPTPLTREQGMSCQKLSAAGWNKIKYKDVQKKLQAAPVFDTLKINSQLRSIAPKSSSQSLLARSDSLTGTITHGLLLQRQKLAAAIKSLTEKHPTIAEDIKRSFLGEDSVKSVSDDLLHFTCAKRAETIEMRRNTFRTREAHQASALAEIPPSASHLFEEGRLTDFLKQEGGVQKVFFPERKPFYPKESSNFRPRPQAPTGLANRPSHTRPRPSTTVASKKPERSGKSYSRGGSSRKRGDHRRRA